MNQHIHLPFLPILLVKIIIHGYQDCLWVQKNFLLSNKDMKKGILKVMETFNKQVKKEVKLQTNFLTPGIYAPSTEVLSLCLDLYSSQENRKLCACCEEKLV